MNNFNSILISTYSNLNRFVFAITSMCHMILLSWLQEEYRGEGIQWESVEFVDNTECLDLIAKKPTGLLLLLDEECRYVCV